MAGNIVEITDSTFENEVLKSDKPVLVDFWAVWCGPCRMIAPHVEALANELSGRLKVGKLNVDDNVGVASRYRVQGIPTLLLFKDGQVKEQLVGYMTADRIKQAVEPHLAAASVSRS
jgi:thioredoxin 1